MRKFVLISMVLVIGIFLVCITDFTSSAEDSIVRFMWWTDNQYVEKGWESIYPKSAIGYAAISDTLVER